MIARYSRVEMAELWKPEARFSYMLLVEIAVAEAQAARGVIPKQAAQAIRKRAKFSLDRILEIEQKTKHDVIAFVTNVAENVGPHGKFVHYGLTSSDVLDTALSLQIREAAKILNSELTALMGAILVLAKKHRLTLCAGRTHGMHAEPTSFGFKILGYAYELRRNQHRLQRAIEQVSVAKLSGAVGTYSSLDFEIETDVCGRLNLLPESVATQVVPRDRHAEVLYALASLGAGIERFCVELRHLQRTEVGEVVEGFSKGQKGSSAMPHKKNPISAENLTGAARLLRSYLSPALENVALWHERDISHSSVERVILPDAFILCDYAIHRLSDLVKGLIIDENKMRENMNLSHGQLFSSHLLMALINKGLSREEAYALVQGLSHTMKKGDELSAEALKNKSVRNYLSASEIEKIFSGSTHKTGLSKAFDRAWKGIK